MSSSKSSSMPIEHQLVQSLVKPAMMDIPPPFLIIDGGYEGVPITITRASTKLLMGPAGIFYTVPINAQPHEWELGGAYIGRRYEEARTWRLLHNRDWTDAVFDTVTNITAAKDATGLLGVANSASTLTATAANGVIRQSITLASAERTSSFYVKRVTGTGDIDITDDGGTNYTTLTGLSSSVWTRHEITRTQANPDVGFRIVTSGDEIEVDFGGVEEGDVATSVVEVGATAVVRAADVPTTTDLRWFNASEGAWSTQFHFLSASGMTQFLWHLDDGTNNNPHHRTIANDSAGDLLYETNDDGAGADLSLAHGASLANTNYSLASSYRVNDGASSLNGATIVTDLTGVMPTGLAMFRFGHRPGGLYLNGNITSLPYWPDYRPGIELQAIAA